jgi:hypothetical protein
MIQVGGTDSGKPLVAIILIPKCFLVDCKKFVLHTNFTKQVAGKKILLIVLIID